MKETTQLPSPSSPARALDRPRQRLPRQWLPVAPATICRASTTGELGKGARIHPGDPRTPGKPGAAVAWAPEMEAVGQLWQARSWALRGGSEGMDRLAAPRGGRWWCQDGEGELGLSEFRRSMPATVAAMGGLEGSPSSPEWLGGVLGGGGGHWWREVRPGTA